MNNKVLIVMSDKSMGEALNKNLKKDSENTVDNILVFLPSNLTKKRKKKEFTFCVFLHSHYSSVFIHNINEKR